MSAGILITNHPTGKASFAFSAIMVMPNGNRVPLGRFATLVRTYPLAAAAGLAYYLRIARQRLPEGVSVSWVGGSATTKAGFELSEGFELEVRKRRPGGGRKAGRAVKAFTVYMTKEGIAAVAKAAKGAQPPVSYGQAIEKRFLDGSP